jgi:hypothetical protein
VKECSVQMEDTAVGTRGLQGKVCRGEYQLLSTTNQPAVTLCTKVGNTHKSTVVYSVAHCSALAEGWGPPHSPERYRHMKHRWGTGVLAIFFYI